MFDMCLNSSTDKPRTHFLWIKHVNISPFSMKTLIARLFLQKLTISPILIGNTLPKSRFNQIKTITAISFRANPVCWMFRVTAATLQCVTPVSNVFTVIMMKIWHHRHTCHHLITAVCYAECILCTFNISGMHDIWFLDTQFSSDCHFYICCPSVLKLHHVIENMLRNCCLKFCVILLSSFEITSH